MSHAGRIRLITIVLAAVIAGLFAAGQFSTGGIAGSAPVPVRADDGATTVILPPDGFGWD